jgi:hypothetical protein
MSKIVINSSGSTQVQVGEFAGGNTVIAQEVFKVTASRVLNTVVVEAPKSFSLSISPKLASVVVTKPQGKIVEITTAGPQGPPFAGAQFFDTTAIGALTSGDTGALLAWNGNVFEPVNELSNNLTIAGGAF